MAENIDLTVAVLTYRRPEQLDAILPVLVTQALTVRDMCASVRILVVDNNPDGSARQQVDDFRHRDRRVVVDYEYEPCPGIPAARNRALSASGNSDILVFIDDDEVPIEDWLSLMLRTFRSHPGASGVVGRVVSEYEKEPSPWVSAGGFFNRRRLPTGTPVDVAATNNLLLDMRVVRALDLRFDERLGLNGGDDTLFTRRLSSFGGPLLWCEEAVVVDQVPAARTTGQWVVRRAFRSGNSWALTSVLLENRPLRKARARVSSAGSGLARVGAGVLQLLGGIVTRDVGTQARGTRTLVRGLGMVVGAVGISYLEYQRPGVRRRFEMARR